mgnify:CR=1 FL=1
MRKCNFCRFVGTFGHERCYKGSRITINREGEAFEYSKKCSWLRKLFCGENTAKTT